VGLVTAPPTSGPKARSGRERALIGLVASLAVIAFVESYQALYHAAQAGNRPIPPLWPYAVEGFTLAMTVAIWDARSRGRHAPWAWVLLVLATAVSTCLQVLDALALDAAGHQAAAALAGGLDAAGVRRLHTALGVLTAAWTPLALLLSFERWMWLAYGGHRTVPADPAPQDEDEDGQDGDEDGQDGDGQDRLGVLPPSRSSPSALPAPSPSWAPMVPSHAVSSSSGRAGGRTRPGWQDEGTLLERARRAAERHLAATGRPIGRDALRQQLRVSNQQASLLLRQLRAAAAEVPAAGNAVDGRRQHQGRDVARRPAALGTRTAPQDDPALPRGRPRAGEDGPRPTPRPVPVNGQHQPRDPLDPDALVTLPVPGRTEVPDA
jgi:hypothetical protein